MMKRLLIAVFLIGGIFLTSNTYAQTDMSMRASVGQENVIDLFPNPAVEFLNVKIINSQLQNATFELYSIIGNQVSIQVQKDGSNQYRIPVSELNNGYYLLVISDQQTRFRETYKFYKK